MDRTSKEELIGTLNGIFNSAQVGLLVDYRGLTVSEMTDLRRKLYESSSQIRILKNRIAKIAIRETPFAELEGALTEPRALVYGDDPVGPAKIISEFVKKSDKMSYISGALVTPTGVSLLDANRMNALGNLPSREELLVKMLFVMKAVQTNFVRTLNEIPASFVRVLAAVAEKKGE